MINLTFNIAQNSNTLIDILSASLTPIIAILGSYIAYQQWKTNEKSRKQSLYDYRYEKIFKPVLDICNKTINSIKDGKIENIEELNELHNTKLTNIEKYSFLLKENDYIQLMINYGDGGSRNNVQRFLHSSILHTYSIALNFSYIKWIQGVLIILTHLI